MAFGRFRANPNYVTYVDLLRQLHALIRDGKGDDAESDEVRDLMDAPDDRLDGGELERIRGISTDLYTLGPESPIQHVDRPNVLDPELGALLRQKVALDDWDGVLQLLRDRRNQISWDRAAPIRGDAYAKLGEHATAALFLAEACRLNPTNDHHALRWSNELAAIGQTNEAEGLRDNLLLKGEALAPDVAIFIGFSRLGRILERKHPEPAEATALAEVLSSARRRLDSIAVDSTNFLAASFAGEALCYHGLGDDDRALAVLADGVASLPNDAELRTMRGLLQYRYNEQAALIEFNQAVTNHARDVWPYYFLAAAALRSDNFDDCITECSAGITRCSEADRDVLAQLYEWMAIAQIKSGAPEQDVKRLLTHAAKLSPYSTAFADAESSAVAPKLPDDEMLLRTVEKITVAA